MTALATIGHNRPTPADIARDITAEAKSWLTEHPVLQNAEEARLAANLARRIKNTIEDAETQRKAIVGPLNERVKEINGEYHEAFAPVAVSLTVLKGRMTAFAEAEELRRQEAAEEKRKAAQRAREAASEAIRDAQEAEQNASFGEAVDVVSLKQAAVRAFRESQVADRDFARAEREAEHVRLAPGLGARAMGLKKHTEYSVTDPAAAIAATGLTEGIAHEIIKAAKAYRELRGQLPPGIATHETRSV